MCGLIMIRVQTVGKGYQQTTLVLALVELNYSKNCVKQVTLSKIPQIGFLDQLSLNTGQKYCRRLQGEHSAILATFIKLPIVINTVLAIKHYKRLFLIVHIKTFWSLSVISFANDLSEK